jgi:soluble lytic murein transglycosylase-like protein
MASLRKQRRIVLGAAVAIVAVCAAAAALAQGGSANSQLDRWQSSIAEASRRFDVPGAWIRDVMRAESAGRDVLDGRPITSPAGAMGLMQIMPKTWAELRARYGLGNDPYDPVDNIFAGAAYLHELYLRYGYPNLFAAYNAGPQRLSMYLLGRRSLPDETLAYIDQIAQTGSAQARISAAPPGAGLFFELRSPAPAGRAWRTFPTSSSDGLFIPLRTAPTYR